MAVPPMLVNGMAMIPREDSFLIYTVDIVCPSALHERAIAMKLRGGEPIYLPLTRG